MVTAFNNPSFLIVLNYVESIKDTPELMDMLSVPKAAAGDVVVYEDVSLLYFIEVRIVSNFLHYSIFHLHKSKTVLKRENFCKVFSMLVNTTCMKLLLLVK